MDAFVSEDQGDCVFVNGGTVVAPAAPEVPEPSIGRPIAFQPSVHENDKSDPLDIHIGERRWFPKNSRSHTES